MIFVLILDYLHIQKQTLIRKKQVQRKQKNLSLKIQVNANQVTMNQKIAMKTKKHRLTTMNNKEAVLYGGRVLLLFISSQLKIRTF